MRGKPLDLLNFKRWRRVCGINDSSCPPVNMTTYLLFFFLLYLSSLPEPKDPPKNVIVSLIPEEVNRVKVTFTAPEEPNGNITAYFVYIYEKDQLIKNLSLNIIQIEENTLTAVIEGLKGGQSYSIQVKPTVAYTVHSNWSYTYSSNKALQNPYWIHFKFIFFKLFSFFFCVSVHL